MKRYILFFALILSIQLGYCQSNFVWDKVDSVAKSKAELYSGAKLFISETWNSAQSVIQNDDKEGGIILIKGIIVKNIQYMGGLGMFKYTYDYTIKFYFKDSKFRIVLDDVYCSSATYSSGNNFSNVVKIPTFEGEITQKFGALDSRPSKANLVEMMSSLKQDLQAIVDSFMIFMKKTNNNDW